MSREFTESLRQADGLLAWRGMPARVDQRLRARLVESRAWRRLLRWVPAVAATSCLVGLGLAALVYSVRDAPPSSLAGLRVEDPSPALATRVAGSQVEILAGQATLADEAAGSRARVVRPSMLRREARGLRVVRGQVEFAVAKRPPRTEPVRVLVSDGEIEVHGTRFTVLQGEEGGTVTLHEGAITFRCGDGRQLEVKPGDSLRWPVPPLPEPVPASASEPVPLVQPALPPPPRDADWREHDRLLRAHVLLERLPALKARGAYHQAARELEAGLSLEMPDSARERLSFELGQLYSHELGDPRKACEQWRDHAWRYPAGRYEDEVERSRRELGCR